MSRAHVKALLFYPELFSERNGIDNYMEDRRVAFENGYEMGVKEAIDEVVEWLKGNVTDWIETEDGLDMEDICVSPGFYDVLRYKVGKKFEK